LGGIFYTLTFLRIMPLGGSDACFYESLFMSPFQFTLLFFGERNGAQPTAQSGTGNAKHGLNASDRVSFASERDGRRFLISPS
jgi:hypothetical protein